MRLPRFTAEASFYSSGRRYSQGANRFSGWGVVPASNTTLGPCAQLPPGTPNSCSIAWGLCAYYTAIPGGASDPSACCKWFVDNCPPPAPPQGGGGGGSGSGRPPHGHAAE